MNAAPIQVAELDPSTEPAYDAFVAHHANALIYYTLEFRNFLRRVVQGVPRYLVARRNDRVVGILPMFVASHPEWGEVVNSLPWWGSHGGCLVSGDDDSLIRAALLAHLNEMTRRCRLGFSTLVLTPDETEHFDEYRRLLSPTTIDRRIGQITDLPADGPSLESSLETTCRQKTRNLVRKALKQGFVAEFGDDDRSWRFLHETHVENMAAISGRAKPWSHFEAIRDLIPADWRQLVTVTCEGRPVAAVLLFRFNGTVEYITPVIAVEFRSRQPLSFAIWHAMLDAARSGYRHWNWGGTWLSQRSLHHFKEGWGATEKPYFYVTSASPESIDALRRHGKALTDAFPFFFLFPFSELSKA